MDHQRQELLLEYFKTGAILVGVVFGLIQLYNATTELKSRRGEHTIQMIAGFSDQRVIKSSIALLRLEDMKADQIDKVQFNADIAPLRQHLITWSACVKSSLCEEEGSSITLLCQRLNAFEYIMAKVQPMLGITYTRANRNTHYLGMLDECADTAEVSPELLN